MAFHGPILYLYLGKSCNSNCQFCVVGARPEPDMLTSGVIERLRHARESGICDVVFSGGDPTIRADILALVQAAREMGYLSVQIQTNGRRISDRAFARQVVQAGATEFSISLHGATPTIQDELSRSKGSFAETVGGIRGLRDLFGDGIVIITNSVITSRNLTTLDDLVTLLADMRVNSLQLAYIHAQGRADSVFEQITPLKSIAMPHIHHALDTALGCGYGMGQIMIEAYPYCFLRGYEVFCSDLFIPKALVRTHNDDSVVVFPMSAARSKGNVCTECLFTSVCYGPWREYPERRGWSEFRAITEYSPDQVIPAVFLGNNAYA